MNLKKVLFLAILTLAVLLIGRKSWAAQAAPKRIKRASVFTFCAQDKLKSAETIKQKTELRRIISQEINAGHDSLVLFCDLTGDDSQYLMKNVFDVFEDLRLVTPDIRDLYKQAHEYKRMLELLADID